MIAIEARLKRGLVFKTDQVRARLGVMDGDQGLFPISARVKTGKLTGLTR